MKGRSCCWLVALAALAADRLSKQWAVSVLKGQRALEVWPGVLRFLYVENTGAAFGVLQGRQTFLVILTGGALLALLIFLLLHGKTLAAPALAGLWLLLGGALGNLIDRLFLGYVIDFIQIQWFSFPIFNIADCCVCVAFALLAAWILLGREVTSDDGRAA